MKNTLTMLEAIKLVNRIKAQVERVGCFIGQSTVTIFQLFSEVNLITITLEDACWNFNETEPYLRNLSLHVDMEEGVLEYLINNLK